MNTKLIRDECERGAKNILNQYRKQQTWQYVAAITARSSQVKESTQVKFQWRRVTHPLGWR